MVQRTGTPVREKYRAAGPRVTKEEGIFTMKKSFIALIGIAVLSLVATGCARFSSSDVDGVSLGTLHGDVTYAALLGGHTQVQLTSKDFEIVKTISSEAQSRNILGLFSTGDSGYAKLFEQARAAGADDVINIKVDVRKKAILMVFWTESTVTMTGTAIKWRK